MESKKQGFQKGTHLLLAPEEQAEIRERIITRRPEEFGIPDSLWTLKKVCAYVRKRHRNKIELFFLPPYAPESNPNEYLNHALKLSVHSGGLPRSKYDIPHKTASFMRTLQHSPDKVSAFFQLNQVSYIIVRE